jgi:hypothetical protein
MCTLLKSSPANIELTDEEKTYTRFWFYAKDEDRKGYFKSESDILYKYDRGLWFICDPNSFVTDWVKVTFPEHAWKIEKWYRQGVKDI